jgi:hypothetical protein
VYVYDDLPVQFDTLLACDKERGEALIAKFPPTSKHRFYFGKTVQPCWETKDCCLYPIETCFGQPWNGDTSNAFKSEILVHNSMLQHPWRTKDPSKATLFFIPMYESYSLHMAECGGKNHIQRMQETAEVLRSRPSYQDHGRAHFMVGLGGNEGKAYTEGGCALGAAPEKMKNLNR